MSACSERRANFSSKRFVYDEDYFDHAALRDDFAAIAGGVLRIKYYLYHYHFSCDEDFIRVRFSDDSGLPNGAGFPDSVNLS